MQTPPQPPSQAPADASLAPAPAAAAASKANGVEVVVHPLVLLSAVDHYNRVAKDTRKRVVGVLLGNRFKHQVDVTNSFAVPFEEDLRNPTVWFLDHNFLETMFWMFKKVNTRENIVGFYSSGPMIKENDLKINELFRRFCADPVFVIIDVRPNVEGLPTTAYMAIEEVQEEGKKIQRVFKHIACSIGAQEAEEVGVEHLLRDINDPSVSTMANEIKHKVESLTALHGKLLQVKEYLSNVLNGRLPINNQIVYNLQNIFNLLPNLNVDELIRAMLVKTNDMHLVMYLASLVRSVIALHNLVNNKIQYRDIEDVLDRSAEGVSDAKAPKSEAKSSKGEPKSEGAEESKP